MKKIYLPLAAVTACLLFSTTLLAQQRTKMEFTGPTSFWQNAANWKRNGIQQTSSGVLPQDGDSILITSGNSAVIGLGSGSGTYTYPASGTLNNVILVVQTGAAIQFGNSGQRFGELNLDNASKVSVEGTGQIKANPNSDSRNKLTIGGVVKYQSNFDYSAVSPGSGPGLIAGPARATSFTGSGASGFTLGTLPVVLVGFNANLTSDNKVTVQWTTQQEVSTNYFNIERSSDGLSWQTIATVKASGYSSTQKSYSIQDVAPQTGTNLYRLRMIDFDANFGFSSVVNVRLSLLGKVSIFPNPTVSTMNVSLGHAPTADWSLSLINQMGQTVVRKIYGKGITTVSLPVSHIPNGNYSVEINDGFTTQSSKLLIAH